MEHYNDWTVISYDVPPKAVGKTVVKYRKQVLVECVCGVQKVIPLTYIKNGTVKGCGCSKKEAIIRGSKKRKKHDGKGTRLYAIWKGMRQRCTNNMATGYFNYGGRGIKTCPEWDSFLVFKEWAESSGYEDNLTIERLNKDGDYEPSNCEWITRSENIARRNKGVDGSKKNRSRFSKQDISEMVEMRFEYNQTYEVIAGAFGTTISHVSRLIKGQYKYTND